MTPVSLLIKARLASWHAAQPCRASHVCVDYQPDSWNSAFLHTTPACCARFDVVLSCCLLQKGTAVELSVLGALTCVSLVSIRWWCSRRLPSKQQVSVFHHLTSSFTVLACPTDCLDVTARLLSGFSILLPMVEVVENVCFGKVTFVCHYSAERCSFTLLPLQVRGSCSSSRCTRCSGACMLMPQLHAVAVTCRWGLPSAIDLHAMVA